MKFVHWIVHACHYFFTLFLLLTFSFSFWLSLFSFSVSSILCYVIMQWKPQAIFNMITIHFMCMRCSQFIHIKSPSAVASKAWTWHLFFSFDTQNWERTGSWNFVVFSFLSQGDSFLSPFIAPILYEIFDDMINIIMHLIFETKFS